MNIGIVGHGHNKFNEHSMRLAREKIEEILNSYDNPVLVSGHSPMGGVDIWAEEIAERMGVPMDIKVPKTHKWDGYYGYKERNIDIARVSAVVHVIVVDEYPSGYNGRRFDVCYHCVKHDDVAPHVKSGGCWTGRKAVVLGNYAVWHIIKTFK